MQTSHPSPTHKSHSAHSATLSHWQGSLIAGSTAMAYGGTFHLLGGSVLVAGSSIANSSAQNSGGAFNILGGSITVTDGSTIDASIAHLGIGGAFTVGGVRRRCRSALAQMLIEAKPNVDLQNDEEMDLPHARP